MNHLIRIGTRGSKLALYQAELVQDLLAVHHSELKVEIVKITTSGDLGLYGGSTPFDTKRVYTKEIEEALLEGEVDLAVHSAKDMSVHMPGGLILGAVLEREDARDCLVSKKFSSLEKLPAGARVGTSSLRRKMQLLRKHPSLDVQEVRGNVDTRIKKVESGEFDAIVLAMAGMKRLGLSHYVVEIFSGQEFYPSPGQGIIAVQCREKDLETRRRLQSIHHRPSARMLDCERAFLRRLEGGCQLPCGISTIEDYGKLKVSGALFSTVGAEFVEQAGEGDLDRPEEAGIELAEKILKRGGQEILEKIRHGKKQ